MANECFELRKVIDPHRHMPEKIKEAFLYGMNLAANLQMKNDTFVRWIIGSSPLYDGTKGESDILLNEVNDWLLLNFSIGEEVLIQFIW